MYRYMSQQSAQTCENIDWDFQLRDRHIQQAQSCEVA